MKKTLRGIMPLIVALALLALPAAAADNPKPMSKMLLGAPDLTASIKCPGHAVAGQELKTSISVRVENKGNAPSGAFFVDLVLSGDANVPVQFAGYDDNYHDNVLLKGGREHVDSLAAGAFLDLPLNGTNRIPADTPAGVYYLAAVIDPGKTVGEKNEGNNVALCRMRISHPKAHDLAVTGFSRPKSPDLAVTGFAHTGSPPGTPPECRLLVTVVNRGPAPIPLGSGARIDVYVNDVLVESVDIDSPQVEQTAFHDVHFAFDPDDPGKSRSVIGTRYIFPPSGVSVTYRCRGVADATGVISETVEANNSFIRIEVIPPH